MQHGDKIGKKKLRKRIPIEIIILGGGESLSSLRRKGRTAEQERGQKKEKRCSPSCNLGVSRGKKRSPSSFGGKGGREKEKSAWWKKGRGEVYLDAWLLRKWFPSLVRRRKKKRGRQGGGLGHRVFVSRKREKKGVLLRVRLLWCWLGSVSLLLNPGMANIGV